MQKAQHQRVMLSSDRTGMGKHTVLTHLSKQIKQNFPTKCCMVFLKSIHVIKKKLLLDFASRKAEGGRTAVVTTRTAVVTTRTAVGHH
jgi:hypothetical protein